MLNVACFVHSCLTDADFVIFSNYCLIGTRPSAGIFYRISISTGITTKHASVDSAAPCAANCSSAP